MGHSARRETPYENGPLQLHGEPAGERNPRINIGEVPRKIA